MSKRVGRRGRVFFVSVIRAGPVVLVLLRSNVAVSNHVSYSVRDSHAGALHAGRGLRHLELGAARQHLGEGDADALDDGEEDGAANGVVARGLEAASKRERAAGEEAGNDGVVGVLLLADALYGAVECREQAAPDAKVAAQHGRAHLDGRDGADAPLAVGRVAEAFDTVPDGAADGLVLSVTFEETGRGTRTPMQKAPPKSLKMTKGQGSRP